MALCRFLPLVSDDDLLFPSTVVFVLCALVGSAICCGILIWLVIRRSSERP
jgi:hypothetical protein